MGKEESVELRRESLSQQVSTSLAEQILEGTYKAETILPSESALAERYGVSRPVIREALKLLWAQGLVETHAGKGAIVQRINEKPLRLFFDRVLSSSEPRALLDLLEVRKQLETTSAALAAANRSDEELSALRKLLDEMKASIDDFDAFTRLDVEFHMLLARFSRNTFLYYLIVSIRESLVKVIKELQLHDYQSSRESVHGFHEAIYAAVAAGDPEEANRTMSEHYEDVLTRIRAAVDTI